MSEIGFIGTGNMTTAIVNGIKNSDINWDIRLFDIDSKKAQSLADSVGEVAAETVGELASECDIIVLAVKPQNFPDVFKQIKGEINRQATIVSIAAGITAEQIKSGLGYDAKIVLAMPNTPMLMGCGAIALSRILPTTEQEYKMVKDIFSLLGIAVDVPSDKMKEIIPINGSSPAFIYLIAKGFVDYAVSVGIDQDSALQLFCKTLEGSAKMMTESGSSIEELIKAVSSPGGTTIEGLKVLREQGLADTIKATCEATTKRAYELSE